MSMNARPAYISPEGEGEIALTVENYGDAPANGTLHPIAIADQLPAGLKVTGIAAEQAGGNKPVPFKCEQATLTCTEEEGVAPYGELEVRIRVKVEPGTPEGELVNHAEVSGGGAGTRTLARPIQISGRQPSFGLEEWNLYPEEEGGGLDTQAGSHPFQVTGSFVLRQGADTGRLSEKPEVLPIAGAKDIVTKLPPGLVGNPTPIARCTLGQFLDKIQGSYDGCAPDTAVGVAAVTLNLRSNIGLYTTTVPIFNLEPYAGEPARFGFYIPEGTVPVVLDTSVRTGEKYAITVGSSNISQTASLLSARTTFWGEPADPRHDESRGWSCLRESKHQPNEGPPCTNPETTHPSAFLTLPTNCAEQLQAGTTLDAWNGAGEENAVPTTEPMLTLDGCNRIPFTPTIEASPTTTFTAAPSGLDFNIDFANEGLTSAEGDAQSELKETTVVLPEGLTINPSAGVGLAGCTREDYKNETLGSEPGAGCPNESKLGTVTIETPLLKQQIDGNVYIAQPYENPFPEPDNGHPGGTLVALYIVAKNPETGVLVKLAGKVTPCESAGEMVGDVECRAPGQLITTFKDNPQLPFDHFNFHFREGQQAPLITPPQCGSYTTQALLSPWSAFTGGVSSLAEPLIDSSSFTLTDDGACPAGGGAGGIPFHPGIVAGMANNSAGAFGELYVQLTRTDAEQEISSFSTTLPPGLSGILKGIPYCSETAIAAARHRTGAQEEREPSCPAESQIGETEVGTGVGQVLAYVPGKIYLAGPFNGHGSCIPGNTLPGGSSSECAPFSIVSITSAKVGPFDLGTVVIRFGLNIDPYTAQVSVSPAGGGGRAGFGSSEPIPTIIDGIVTHVRDIRVYIDRPNFTINPTHCAKENLSSTLQAHEGATATVSSSFLAVNCASLKFEPKVTASVSGKVTKTEGTSFHLTVTKPEGQGEQADVKKFKIELPVQLPSRLTTLQKACTSAQFEANPAGCPAASSIGYMKVHTPLLSVPVEGPMYFVSHGGEAFPSLEIVLQGDGVEVILVGQTFISKAGITSSTFSTLPDVPFSTAEVELHNGPYSALTGTGNLCAPTTTTTVKRKVAVKRHGKTVRNKHGKVVYKTKKVRQAKPTSLSMPTEIVGQNGGTPIVVNTPVSVTECPKVKAAKKVKHKKKAAKKGEKKGKRGKG